MALSSQDAAAALRDIEKAERLSSTLRGYEIAAPHFIVWGIVWAIGYGLSDLAPAQANVIWATVVPIGLVAGFVIARAARGRFAWRHAAMAATIFVFFCATFFVMAPANGRQIAAFIPLVVATVYVLLGIWVGPRYAVAGIVVAALTLIGFVLLGEHFFLWMAGVGGGSLVLAGIWLKRA